MRIGPFTAGHLLSRTWARGVLTTYTNNSAGEVAGIGYSDGTPSILFQFDRLGRRATITDGVGTRVLQHDLAGRLLAETNTSSLLSGLGLTSAYDEYGRRTNLTLNSQPATLNQKFAYDAASRPSTVSSGAESATYSYLANSPLVEHITFKQNGTTQMTTTKQYDKLNRLTKIETLNFQPSTLNSFSYTYNDANQRVRVTMPTAATGSTSMTRSGK